jgi:Condensation domain
MMEDTSVRLDALSEMMALSSYGNTKNIIVTAVETKGPLEEEAMTLALRQAATNFPRLVSCVKEVRERGRYRLVWDQSPDRQLPVKFSEVQETNGSTNGLDSFLRHMAPRLDRDWDLFTEPTAEVHVVRLAKDHHIVAPVIHHVASDAGVASEFGKEFLVNYHEILTGQRPNAICQPHCMSTTRKRLVRIKKPRLRDQLVNARQAVARVFERPTLPTGNGLPDDQRQHHIKRVFSPEQTERINKAAAKNGASLVDLLVAAANRAVDEWNQDRNIPPGLLTTSMSVNMKSRFREFGDGNNSALLFFKSRPSDREDTSTFARSIALARIKQFRNQMDFKFVQNVSRMTTALRAFPFGIRRRIVSHLVNKHQLSIAITVLGVIWPTVRNGRPTADSCLTHSGDLAIKEVHGLGYKLLSNTHLLLIVYAYRNRLNFVFSASASVFRRQEAQAFMDLLMEYLQETPVATIRAK